jgi:hypothetical protein
MNTETTFAGARWTRFERVLLVALLIAYIPGIPGTPLTVETREPQASTVSDVLLVAYTVAGLAPLVALAASWKWRRVAAWAGIVAGAFAVVLPALDFAGIYGAPPPAGMVVVNLVVMVLGAAIAWRSWRLVR